MTEMTHADDIGNRIQELDNNLNESTGILKSIHSLRDEAQKIIGMLNQKKDELNQHERDLATYIEKLMIVSQKAEALLSPILRQKEHADALEKKVTEAIAGIDGTIQQKMDATVQQKIDASAEVIAANQKSMQEELNKSIEAIKKEMEARVVQSANEQQAAMTNIAKHVDAGQKQVEMLKVGLDGLGKTIKQSVVDTSQLRTAITELTGATGKQKEELLKTFTEAQEKQKQELQAELKDLREKSIKNLEKETAQIKSVLNAAVAKLNHVKFKKLLGL